MFVDILGRNRSPRQTVGCEQGNTSPFLFGSLNPPMVLELIHAPYVQLSAWNAITQLSHALESTLGLLCVTLQDGLASQPPSSSALSGHNLRQCYSTAIIRLVNGLVDPLQSGVYARSIASIAAQLSLPVWLVEVRHAATHEELPSLEILREAAQEVIISLPSRLWNLPADTSKPPLVPKMAVP